MNGPIIQYDEQELKQVLDRIVKRTMQIDFTWDWPCGVAFYGICKAWEVTGNQEYLDFLVQWVDEYLTIGLPPLTVNAVSMGHTLITLHEATGDSMYLDLAVQKAEYLRHQAVRFGEGVFQHTVSQNNDFPEQAWADTLFMAAYFLLRMGVKLQNEEYIADGLNQYYWHEEFLQDETTNLYYHGWNNLQQNHMSGVFWARANAWAALTMAEALKLINYLYPMFMRIDGSLRDQLSALVRLQSPEGMWHTILTDDSSYLETSASAGIAASLAIYGHPLHQKYIQKALQGIMGQIAPDGTVKNVSAGTAVMKDPEDYKQVPRKRIQGWGQGLTLAFLAALLQYNPHSNR
ncbi:unsaturated rhamnogalacturonyl hydrolase [Hydrogenispora ethanolica]|uniref:Unsaturated rhamnogalacturonyl hydrolase n=1 Tax=Hydrogenispora ethanolica TaxID=1082276 RepID=A0A4V2QEZ0_HYDET|nr:glycoside hydrolase family 88 protein [Hydrogenispora ethanolica]TCL69917.1 unsaturated rhamnogalacturonyl hydrolase [Hydrogenispora ethanolica]